MDPADTVRGFLDALGVPAEKIPIELDARAALYRTQLADKRMLVLLDNARDTGQVEPLLPGAPGCLVLVTSRNRLTSLTSAAGAHPLPLDLLTLDEARDLLARRLGPRRVAVEPDSVEAIIAACTRLPLALAIVAARAASHPRFPLAALAAELREARTRLDALTGDDPATDMRAVFSWSYQQLTDDAARLFRLLGLHPGPDISTPAAASLAGVDPATVRPLLAELTRAHLVNEQQPGRYSFHDLLRAYAADLARTTDGDDQQAAVQRMLDHYLHTAVTADQLLNPTRNLITLTPPRAGVTPEHHLDYEQAMTWFSVEHRVLLAAVNLAAGAGVDGHTWQLAWALADFLDRCGHWQDLAATQRAGLAAARRLADLTAQARVHIPLALAYTRLGRDDDAQTELQQALDLYNEVGDQVGQGYAHLNISRMLERRGRLATVLDHDLRALDLFRAAGQGPGEAHALNMVGWHLALLGDHERAVPYCEEALALLQALGDRAGQAYTLDSLGYVHHHLGHHTQAIVCYQHALDLLRDLGERYQEADTLTHLGDTHVTTGSASAARDAYHQALTILEDLDHPDADQVRTKLHQLDQPTPPEPTSTAPAAGNSSW
jgi:tetratricopeptide (TPR) repeat protein